MKKNILLSFILFLAFTWLTPCLANANDKTIVYYFWSNPRCVSCKKIETYTQEAVNKTFSKEINDGSIEFRIIEFTKDKEKQKRYGLYTKAVVLSKVKDGKELKYKNLDKIWTKLNNKEKFENYVIDEVQKFHTE